MGNSTTNLSTSIKRSYGKAAIVFLALSLLSGLSCGKRKPPLPPTERVVQRAELTGFQRGSQVILSWKMPARNAAKGNTINISRIDVYRLAEPATADRSLSEEEFANRSTLIATVPVTGADFGLTSLNYRDNLEFAGQAARLRYAVRFVNDAGQKASFSNFFLIEPAARVASAPTSLLATVSQDAVALRWSAPTKNADGSDPVNVLGYNIYRSSSENEAAKLLNSSPVTSEAYSDPTFSFGIPQFYFVRAVSSGPEGEPVESQESNIVKVEAKDTFAPAPPSAITLAASLNTVSIFFASNTESDVAGYLIYRSEDPNLAKSEWTKITPALITTNTFQDATVETGHTYYYYLTATDKTGNVSEPSEVVSETVR